MQYINVSLRKYNKFFVYVAKDATSLQLGSH